MEKSGQVPHGKGGGNCTHNFQLHWASVEEKQVFLGSRRLSCHVRPKAKEKKTRPKGGEGAEE